MWKLRIQAIPIMIKFYKFCHGSYWIKLNKTFRYYQIFVYHQYKQRQIIQNALKKSKQNKQKQYASNYQETLKQKMNQFNQLAIKKKSEAIQSHQKMQYKENAKGLLHTAMKYLSLYYESVQNLVQGRREVLNNQHFKFQDGLTVTQKKDKFEKMLSKLIGKVPSNLKK